ncbi:hypothetical protein SAMN02745866_00012 [Alteromonadaceae bacterium Bs31]|nr:hypothetical protein SAMN02745866_00012 [Alteromonadaceae bacterium Bs31]
MLRFISSFLYSPITIFTAGIVFLVPQYSHSADSEYSAVTEESFSFDNIRFKWGATLNDVSSERTCEKVKYLSKDNVDNCTYRAKEILGFKTKQITFIATTGINTPIYHLSFPIIADEVSTRVDIAPWVQKLISIYGEPSKIDEKINQPFEVNPSRNSSVYANAEWNLENLKVYIAAIEGYRHTEIDGAPYIALVNIKFSNQATLAAPFVDAQRKKDEKLAAMALRAKKPSIFKIPRPLTELGLNNENAGNKHVNLKLARLSTRALSEGSSFETPENIAKMLNNSTIAVWEIAEPYTVILSTKWNSEILSSSDTKISCTNMYPARGPGSMIFYANSISVKGEYKALEIKTLVNHLAKVLKTEIKCQEYPDS